MIKRFFIKNFPLFWLLGLLLPFLYFFYVLNLDKIASFFRSQSRYTQYLVILLLIQLLSLSFSIFYDFFTITRFIGSLHNIFVFSFILLGYSLVEDKSFQQFLASNTYVPLLILTLLVIIGTIYSVTTRADLIIPDAFSVLGIGNQYTEVKFNRIDWFIFSYFPRTTVFTQYPNATGLIFLLLQSLFVISAWNRLSSLKKNFSFLILIGGCFMTGSRTFVLLSAVLFLGSLLTTKNRLVTFILILLPVILVAIVPAVEYLLSLRVGSNQARTMIYQVSFDLMLRTNFIFGLGIKPLLPEFYGGYPMGSHSTYLGFFIRFGLLGGFLLFFGFVYLLLKFFNYLLKVLFTKFEYSPAKFYTYFSFIVFNCALFVEDIDASELVALLFGMYLWFFANANKYFGAEASDS